MPETTTVQMSGATKPNQNKKHLCLNTTVKHIAIMVPVYYYIEGYLSQPYFQLCITLIIFMIGATTQSRRQQRDAGGADTRS